MATATRSTATAKGSVLIGVYLPDQFPEDEVTTALEVSGYVPAFTHADPAETVAACREHQPEVLLLGAGRADAEVLGLVGEVGEMSADTKVVLICKRSGNGEVRKALDAGVSGLVSLNEAPSALPPVIEVVRAGQLSVPGSRGAELEKQVLTSREKQILGLVVMGMTNAEIAGKLYLAESTVKSHLSSAFAKLGVASRSEAASVILDPRLGAGLGILTIPSS
jgi:two-component system response regulator DesR